MRPTHTSAQRLTARVAAVALVLGLAVVAQLGSQPALADTAPAPGAPATVTADALPTWQVDGIVWSQAVVGNTVYATGSFATARPPGVAKGGPGEVAVGNLIAYDIRTGERIASFDHVLNGQGLVVHGSQDGTRLYVGGDFTAVDGQPRGHIAAFDIASGALVPGFAPTLDATVRAITTNGSWVYAGGAFFYANGIYRQRLVALAAVNGGVSKAWAPRASTSDVRAMVTSPDRSKIVIGGSFQTLSGVTANGQGVVDPISGAVLPWAASSVIVDYDKGGITNLTTDGTLVYGSGYAFGTGGVFEGTYAADPTDGTLVWVADCLGDTYGVFPSGEAVYSVGHAHNCSAIGSFPDTSPRVRWQRALAMTKAPTGTITAKDAYGWDFRGNARPSVLQWFPGLDTGSVSGQSQAAWAVSGTDDYVVLGGEFPVVNGDPQQGLTRFAVRSKAPLKARPRFTFTPTRDVATIAQPIAPGAVRVSFGTAWDRDNYLLTYDLFRDGTTPVATTSVGTTFWDAPTIGLTDPAAPAGTHTYKVRVTDPDGNTNWTTESAPVTIDTSPAAAYPAKVLADGAASYWRFGESAGTIAYDWTGQGNDAFATGAGVTWRAAGATGDGDTAATLAGTVASVLAGQSAGAAPQTFTTEAWFSTTTRAGGKIIGFGDGANGSSTVADRHVYMDTGGRLNFGVADAAKHVVRSPAAYNDGRWHHVAASFGRGGMALYVDGALVGRDASVTQAVDYRGRWMLGGDSLGGWANAPSNRYLAGAVDDVAVYPTVLGIDAIRSHVEASGRQVVHVPAPADTYGTAVMTSAPQLFWRLDETSGTVATDTSDHGETGGYSGTVTFGRSGITASSRAVRLGTNGLVSSVYPSVAPTAYTAEGWFQTTSTTGGVLMDFGTSRTGASTTVTRSVQMLNDGRVQLATAGGASALVSPSALNDGTWHHVVATQDAQGMRLYVDGVVVGQNAVTDDAAVAGYWRFGGDTALPGSTSGYLAGTLDELAVYPRALSSADVKAHYLAAGRTAPNSPPVASFTLSATGSTVSVDGSASSDADGPIAGYAWSFGDGSTATGATATHDYGTAGTFTVTLTVTDTAGATATTTRSATVTSPDRPPVADFTVSTPQDLTVAVDASASSDPDGPIAAYAWDFGDGSSGSGVTAQHRYAAPGTYTVALTVTDGIGTTASTTRSVSVVGPFAADAFTRTLSSSLGSADVGGPWTLQGAASGFGVNGSAATFRMGTAGTGAAAQLGSVASTDTDLRVSFATSVIANGGGQYVYLTGRGTFSDAYRAKVQVTSTGAVTAALTRVVAGAETSLASAPTGITATAGTPYATRLQVVGSGGTTTLRFKIWPQGQPEPSGWLLTSTDTTASLQAAGAVGLRTYLSGSATNAPVTVSFDDLSARPTA